MSAVDTGSFSHNKKKFVFAKSVCESRFAIKENKNGVTYDGKYSYQIFYRQD